MKKRSIFTVLAAVLVMAVVLTSFAVPSFARRKLGDVDGDGFITSGDARIALRASVKLDVLSEEEALAADVDGDGFITSGDARTILRASVKLDKLPDVFVGESQAGAATDPVTPSEPEETTIPDATPTDPAETTTEPEAPSAPEETTTEPEAPSAPEETTTEPEAPSAPEETTTEPEIPSAPEETTTEPEVPSAPEETTTEQRVDIIPPAANNEFDILRNGTYYFTGTAVDASGRSDLEIAKTSNTLYLASTFSNVKIAVLTIDDKVYLVNPEKKQYLDLNSAAMKAEMKMLGLDVSDFTNTGSFDFSFFPPLDQATSCEVLPDGSVKYIFQAPDGAINVTLYGTKLVCIENARDGSVYRIDFTMVTTEVPSEMRELSGLKKVLQTKFISSLL